MNCHYTELLLGAINLFSACVLPCYQRHLSREHWDFLLLTTSSWIAQYDFQLMEGAADNQCHKLAVQLLHLSRTSRVAQLVTQLSAANQLMHVQMEEEWHQLFHPEWSRALLNIFVSATRWRSPGILSVLVLDCVGEFVCSVPASIVNTLTLPPLYDPDLVEEEDDDSTARGRQCSSERLAILLSWSRRLISSPHRFSRLTAFNIMYCVLSEIVDAEKTKNPRETDNGDLLLRLPHFFDLLIKHLDGSVSDILCNMSSASEELAVKPNAGLGGVGLDSGGGNDMEPKLMAYLLTWQLTLDYLSRLSIERRSMTAEYIRSMGVFDRLLQTVLYLIPDTTDLSEIRSNAKTLFQRPCDLSKQELDVDDTVHWSCILLCSCVRTLPALVRSSLSSYSGAVYRHVGELITSYLSPVLIADEFAVIRKTDKAFGNMTVCVGGSNEVRAVYNVDGVGTELLLSVPPDFPLSTCGVELGTRGKSGPAGSSVKWKVWSRQLIGFLRQQNGSILDGLLLWKQSVDKHFEGVEECNICFYVLHGSNYQLPKIICRTCHKPFHSACLYKWFNTSGKSTCPMCRQMF